MANDSVHDWVVDVANGVQFNLHFDEGNQLFVFQVANEGIAAGLERYLWTTNFSNRRTALAIDDEIEQLDALLFPLRVFLALRSGCVISTGAPAPINLHRRRFLAQVDFLMQFGDSGPVLEVRDEGYYGVNIWTSEPSVFMNAHLLMSHFVFDSFADRATLFAGVVKYLEPLLSVLDAGRSLNVSS